MVDICRSVSVIAAVGLDAYRPRVYHPQSESVDTSEAQPVRPVRILLSLRGEIPPDKARSSNPSLIAQIGPNAWVALLV